MLLKELKSVESSGTYAAVLPTPGTLALIRDWADKNKIVIDDNLHVTLLFSRKPLRITCCKDEFVATGVGFAKLGDALVLKLNCPAIEARHKQFIAQGGTHDFPEFIPHMTIQAKSELKPEDVPMMDFGLIFSNEYSEPLKL